MITLASLHFLEQVFPLSAVVFLAWNKIYLARRHLRPLAAWLHLLAAALPWPTLYLSPTNRQAMIYNHVQCPVVPVLSRFWSEVLRYVPVADVLALEVFCFPMANRGN